MSTRSGTVERKFERERHGVVDAVAVRREDGGLWPERAQCAVDRQCGGLRHLFVRRLRSHDEPIPAVRKRSGRPGELFGPAARWRRAPSARVHRRRRDLRSHRCRRTERERRDRCAAAPVGRRGDHAGKARRLVRRERGRRCRRCRAAIVPVAGRAPGAAIVHVKGPLARGEASSTSSRRAGRGRIPRPTSFAELVGDRHRPRQRR